jgi:hypothetical protein
MTQKLIIGWLPLPMGAEFDASRRARYNPRGIYQRALHNRANPRSRRYMQQLLEERFPGAELATTQPGGDVEIVLLYPDANGLGYSAFERRLPAETRVLNGRRRELVLDNRTRRVLRARRALERSFAVELAALAAAAVLTPFLLAYDLLRGRT